MSKVIALCNQKGGVGKTTTAINLSAYLALFNKKILLVDIDPQGNATSGLGIDKNSIKSSIYNVLLDHLPIADSILPTQVANLSLIPSNINLTGAEVELVGIMGREYKLKKALGSLNGIFDLVFIDCPPSLGLLTVNALTAADSVIIPIQCEYYALEGLGQLINTIKLVKENLNNSLFIEGVLLTMADFRTNLTNEVISEVRSSFTKLSQSIFTDNPGKVYQTVIPRNIKLTEAPGFGKPIAYYDKDSAGALKYQEFAIELLGLEKENSKIENDNVSNSSNQNRLENKIIEQNEGVN